MPQSSSRTLKVHDAVSELYSLRSEHIADGFVMIIMVLWNNSDARRHLVRGLDRNIRDVRPNAFKATRASPTLFLCSSFFSIHLKEYDLTRFGDEINAP